MTHEYVNLKQIARRLNRSYRTVMAWRYKPYFALPFPPPVIAKSSRGVLVWDWAIVELWWERVGRSSKWGIAR